MGEVRLAISAVVVTRNESKYLLECLRGIDYCDEIIVVDLNSEDDSVAIATAFGAKVISFGPAPYVELVHQHIGEWVKNKWVLITDPDEVADSRLKGFITTRFDEWKNDSALGCIRAPMIYYVGDRPFYGTGWGPTNRSRVYIVNLDGYEFTGVIHKGRKLKAGYKEIYIRIEEGKIDHYWVESLGQLVSKCRRYLRHEDGKLSDAEKRTIWQMLKMPLITFYGSFIYRKGYRDGFLGLALSGILSWYNVAAYLKKNRN